MLRGVVMSAIMLVAAPDLAELQDQHIAIERGALILPAKSPIRPVHLPTRNKDYFEFKGRFVVSGTYHYDRNEYQDPKRHKRSCP